MIKDIHLKHLLSKDDPGWTCIECNAELWAYEVWLDYRLNPEGKPAKLFPGELSSYINGDDL